MKIGNIISTIAIVCLSMSAAIARQPTIINWTFNLDNGPFQGQELPLEEGIRYKASCEVSNLATQGSGKIIVMTNDSPNTLFAGERCQDGPNACTMIDETKYTRKPPRGEFFFTPTQAGGYDLFIASEETLMPKGQKLHCEIAEVNKL